MQQCHLPTHCLCGGNIKGSIDCIRHQVHELPILKLQITEYQLQKGHCEKCLRKQTASLPVGVTWGITGPRLTAFMSDLVTHYGLSRREQKQFLVEHFAFHISLGTVFNKQKIVNTTLETPVSELLPIIKASISVHADETGLLENLNALWTFLETEGVEPTNNHAERSLRPAVIWRKKYFCTRSDYGTEFVARSASIQATCRLQGKSSFKFLSELMINHFAGIKTPALALLV